MYMWHAKLSAKVTVRHRLRLSSGAMDSPNDILWLTSLLAVVLSRAFVGHGKLVIEGLDFGFLRSHRLPCNNSRGLDSRRDWIR